MRVVSAITAGCVAAIGTAVLLTAKPAQYDLVVRNGKVIDGTGAPAYAADLAVKDGRIAKIGKVEGKSAKEIDAKGMVVAPGFIDVHTHAENILEIPRAENFLRMGVTTLVVGNCGNSELNIGAFFKQLETRTKPSVNIASLIGHNTVRRQAMRGNFDREPKAHEMKTMRALVDRAMREGAVGLSSGLIYMPGTFSKTDEIVELAKVAKRYPYGGTYATHMRNEGYKIFEALKEAFTVARESGVALQISHLKLGGNNMWGKGRQVLDAIEAARREGLNITHDQYVYTASSTSLSQVIPDEALEGGREAFKRRLNDPAKKREIVAGMKKILERAGRKDYAYAQIASYSGGRSLNGKRIPEAARIKMGSDALEDQIELIIDIQRNGGATGIFHGIHEDDLQLFLKHPKTMFASDAGVRRPSDAMPHPRGYGNNARVLERYVGELKLLKLEEAIRKMTSLPASTFHIRDRGSLREGRWADIVVFDPEKIKENTTYERPHQFATGFAHVIVNGVQVIRNGAHTGAKPGKALRRE